MKIKRNGGYRIKGKSKYFNNKYGTHILTGGGK